jgi:hypothetical protein
MDNVRSVKDQLADALQAARSDPNFSFVLQDPQPKAPIRGVSIINDIMQEMAQTVERSVFRKGDVVWSLVAEPSTDPAVVEHSEGNIVYTDWGIFVVKMRPGIIVEIHETHCQVAEIGRRGNKVLGRLSLLDLIERMGVLPADAKPFDFATLSEDDEFYRLIYEPLEISSHFETDRKLLLKSVLHIFRQHPCRYTNLLFPGGRSTSESLARLCDTFDLAKRLRADLLDMTADRHDRWVPSEHIKRRAGHRLHGTSLQTYNKLMRFLGAIKRKAR